MNSDLEQVSLRFHFERVLEAAKDQVLIGKGEDRHGRGRDFADQPTFKILDLVGPGYAAGQAIKKIEEALGLIESNHAGANEDADRELLGAIGYLGLLAARQRSRS